MGSLDNSPITDAEIVRVLHLLLDAAVVVEAVMERASAVQLRAVYDAYPWENRADAMADFEAWLGVVLDGTTGLHVRSDAA